MSRVTMNDMSRTAAICTELMELFCTEIYIIKEVSQYWIMYGIGLCERRPIIEVI